MAWELDTCHSGGVTGRQSRAPDSDQLVRELRSLEAVVFTSSRGGERSQELADCKGGHGAFTCALLEGMAGEGGIVVSEGSILMKDLDAYVSRRVPVLTDGTQHPITEAPNGYPNFPIAVLK